MKRYDIQACPTGDQPGDQPGAYLDVEEDANHDLGDKRQPTGANRPLRQEHVWGEDATNPNGWRCSCGSTVSMSGPPVIGVSACAEAWKDYSARKRLHMNATCPRFLVKPAAEMREGEPCSPWMQRHVADEQRESCERSPRELSCLWGKHSERCNWAVVDTHSPDWQAFDAKHRKAALQASPIQGERYEAIAFDEAADHILPEITKPKAHHWNHDLSRDRYHCTCGAMSSNPPRNLSETACEVAWLLYADRALPQANPHWPSDADIVRYWEMAMSGLEAVGDYAEMATLKRTGVSWCTAESGGSATWAQYQAARTRELHRKAAEARERERTRVVCEGTLSDDY